MAKTTPQILIALAAVALVATLSLTVIATQGDSDGENGSVMQRLHAMGQRIHGSGHHSAGHMHEMAQLIDQLNLTPEQQEHLDKIHAALGSQGADHAQSMIDLHDHLVAQFEQGRIETEAVRQAIDGHVEQIRARAYAMTDELIALVNSLDAEQRAIVSEHLQQMPGTRSSDG